MALLTKFGDVIYVRKANANANMSGIRAAHKPKFVTDRSALARREQRKIERLEEKILMRKQIREYLKIKP